jgi:hypothetical protein
MRLYFNRENILYGSPYPDKRLDIYLPPSRSSTADGQGSSSTLRPRKHSTVFADPADPGLPANVEEQGHGESASSSKFVKAPVVVPYHP